MNLKRGQINITKLTSNTLGFVAFHNIVSIETCFRFEKLLNVRLKYNPENNNNIVLTR